MLVTFELAGSEDGELIHVCPTCVESVTEKVRGDERVCTLVMESGDKFLVKDGARDAAERLNAELLRLDGGERWDAAAGEGD